MVDTTDEAALLAAIIAQPEEDTPRLAYADLMDELGHRQRAEFIRVQVELAAGEDADGWVRMDAAVGNLMRRERELLEGPHKNYWPLWQWAFGPDAKNNMPDGWNVASCTEMRRGFLDQLTCPADSWLKDGDAIRARHPVTRVRLTTVPQTGSASSDVSIILEVPDWVYAFVANKRVIAQSADMCVLLSARWPGVTFELPG